MASGTVARLTKLRGDRAVGDDSRVVIQEDVQGLDGAELVAAVDRRGEAVVAVAALLDSLSGGGRRCGQRGEGEEGREGNGELHFWAGCLRD